MYLTVYADPPWPQKFSGKYKKHSALERIEYPVMSVEAICELPVSAVAHPACHLWLWTTNQYLREGFQVMESWGFKYLAPITWVKPSGIGNYFVHRTQTMLFGYRGRCSFPLGRYKPTVLSAGVPSRHSKKPTEAYELIESISPAPRLEMFARSKRDGWDVWGNEVDGIELPEIID